jgi:glycerol-3-phosphate acyltransferase PlsY
MSVLDYWPLPAAYLIGSLPFGFLLPLWLKGEDVRKAGSGNIGSTNVLRTQGKALGAAVQVLDLLKGVGAAWLCRSLLSGRLGPLPDDAVATIGAFMAVIGHCFPVWLKFRGGKGVNAGLGGMVMASWLTAILALATFIAVVLKWRMVSLGSIVGSISFLFWAALVTVLHGPSSWWVVWATTPTVLVIVLRHHENIGRLFAGTEHKF